MPKREGRMPKREERGSESAEKGSGKLGPGHSKGRRNGSRHDDLPTLPVVIGHMRQLLDLPVKLQAACTQCLPYSYSRENPAPPLAPQAGAVGRTVLGTIELDSFEAAAELLQGGWSSPAVLNMANCYNCGGAWCNKKGSQEEDLFRCSSLPLSLWPRRRINDMRMPEFEESLPRITTIYPFSECDVMYSPHVLVCRSRDGAELEKEQQFVVSVLSSAAQDLRTNRPHYDGPFDRHLNREKMRSILWAAVAHGNDALVLGAYGCGAFRHDPHIIADMFSDLVGAGGEFEGRFKIVLFAIIKSDANLHAFSAKFPKLTRVPPCTATSAVQHCLAASVASPLSHEEKAALALAKKIRDIMKLEQQQQCGIALQGNQLKKIALKNELASEFLSVITSLPAGGDIAEKVQDVLMAVTPCMKIGNASQSTAVENDELVACQENQ